MKNLYKIQDELYIVSDKEKSSYCIKECPMTGLNIDRCDCQIFTACSNKVGNIILTTNKSLIKDGVQSIDDEFLEWFIKNPSCEIVDIGTSLLDGKDGYGYYGKYKIIIPKEENKQSIKDRIMSETSEEIKQKARDYGNSLVEKQETVFENAKLILRKHILKNKEQVIKDLDEMREQSKEQETLEESGEYQQELFNYLHDLGVTALQSEMQEIERIVLAMQDKNKYSEEEVLPLLEMLQKCKEYFLIKTDLKSEERADAIGQVLEKLKNK